jgi:DNA replication protein DnaC
MLNHETVSRLKELRLFGMVSSLESQRQQTEVQALPFEDRLGLLIDTEIALRETKKCARLLTRARLKEPSACIENIDYDPKRGLDRPLLLSPISAASAREFLELIDDRIGKSSIILTSQYPVDSWHDRIKEPTVADAILDRIIHISHRIVIKGGSMRKRKGLGS